MFKTVTLAFAATTLALSSTAAFARDEAPTPPAAPTVASAPAAQSNSQVRTRYCLADPVMAGTLVPRQSCKPLGQWRVDGVDPLKL